MRTVTAKQHNCRFLVLKRNIQNVAIGFALFTVVENSRFFWLKSKHIFHFYMWDNTHIQLSLVLCCPHTILCYYIWLIEMGLY